MAILKVTKGGKSLTAAINYVDKKAALTSGKDCADDRVLAIEEMKITKQVYDKTDGRQYKHYVQSFAPGEISPEKAHQIGKEWAENNFKGYEVFIGTHVDQKHVHNHFIVNSVSFENGQKIQVSKHDLKCMKKENDRICQREGLSIPERSKQLLGQVRAYDTNKYQLLQRINQGEQVKSYVLDTAIAAKHAISQANSRETFIKAMQSQGYAVDWQEQRKNITVKHPDGHKVRMSNLAKTFNEPSFTKEGMQIEFGKPDKQVRRGQSDSRRYPTGQPSLSADMQQQSKGRDGSREQPAQTSLSRVSERISAVKERAGQVLGGNEQSRSITRDTSKVTSRSEQYLGR